MFSALWLATVSWGFAQTSPVEVPRDVKAFDTPNDAGRSVTVTWSAMAYDKEDIEYVIEGSRKEAGDYIELGRVTPKGSFGKDRDAPWWAWDRSKSYHFADVDITPVLEGQDEELKKLKKELRAAQDKVDSITAAYTSSIESSIKGLKSSEASRLEPRLRTIADDDLKAVLEPLERERDLAKDRVDDRMKQIDTEDLYFRVRVVKGEAIMATSRPVVAAARGNWFDARRLNSFLFMMLFGAVVFVMVRVARHRKLFLRKLPGLAAIDEALGRATEMGRPVYYMTGREDFSKVSTFAAVTILGEVAKKCAGYGTILKVPHTVSVVYAVSEEVTKQAYITAGRVDAYKSDINFYVTDDQFGYTAAVDGMMVRERPAAIIYMGYYYAESLVLAETGSSVSAIQIAGTDADSQLPFFVTACDYTLIGEELYAAGAYLSGDPTLVGTLRGQDVGKAFVLLALVLGTVTVLIIALSGKPDASELIRRVLQLFGTYS